MQYALDVAFEFFSYVNKSLMNANSTNQFGECPTEGGKQASMSMYDTESSSKDDEASLQEDGGREAITPPLNDECTPMIKAS